MIDSLHQGRTVLLSAGPRSGKTELLRRWQQEARDAAFLQFTSDDADPRFFLQRFQEELGLPEPGEDAPVTGWGATLGRSLSASRPDCCLLLDDFHLIEGTELEPEIMGFIRHFPLGGALAIASRHRFPSLQRPNLTVIDFEGAPWQEQPATSDLLALPAPTLISALALYLLESSLPFEAGWDLHHRGLAEVLPDQRMRFRNAWNHAAQQALTHPLPQEVWQGLEQDLESQLFDALCLQDPCPLIERVQQLPLPVRSRHGVFMAVEGHRYLRLGHEVEAEGHFREILAHRAPDSFRFDVQISLRALEFEHRIGSPDLSELTQLLPTANSLQRARVFHLLGQQACQEHRVEAALEAWQAVLAVPAMGRCAVVQEHLRALESIGEVMCRQRRDAEAVALAQHEIALVQDHGFEGLLLASHVKLRELATPAPPERLASLLAIPDEAFSTPSPASVSSFVTALARRALQLRAWDYFDALAAMLAESSPKLDTQPYVDRIWGLRLISLVARRSPSVDSFYDQFFKNTQQPRRGPQRLIIGAAWLRHLYDRQRLDEAHEVLAELRSFPMLEREARALASYAAALELAPPLEKETSPLHALVGGTGLERTLLFLAADLIPDLRPSPIHLRAFGPFEVGTHCDFVDAWVRRRARVMLAHLVRAREGLQAKELAACLAGDEHTVESVHTAAFNLRKSLAPLGLSDLVISNRGGYRIDWGQVDFFDLGEFDRLLAKARSLKAKRCQGAAALLASIALMLARGPVLEDVSGDFEDLRAAYEAAVAEARQLADDPASLEIFADRADR